MNIERTNEKRDTIYALFSFFFFFFFDSPSVGASSSTAALRFLFSCTDGAAVSAGATNASARCARFCSVVSSCYERDEHLKPKHNLNDKHTFFFLLSASFASFSEFLRKYSPDSSCKSTCARLVS